MKLLLMLPALGLMWPSAPPTAASPPATSAAQDTATQVYERLTAEADEAYQAWRKKLTELRKAAAESGEEVPAEAYTRPWGPFIPKFLAAAEDYAGTEDAVPFLVWVVQNGFGVDDEQAKDTFRHLVDVHAASPQLADLGSFFGQLGYFFDEKEAASLVLTLEKETTSDDVRAWAIYSRLSATLEKAAIDSDEFKNAKAEMLAALEKSKDRRLSSEVKGQIDVRETFSIGMVAPDIHGIDLDGTKFSLSDYKGKVLFVDFWGDW